MNKSTASTLKSLNLKSDQAVELLDVGWRGFETIVQLIEPRSSPRVIYLDGTLTLVSPSMPHERLSRRLCLFVLEVASGLGLPCVATGSTTWKRADCDVGVEGDETFYLTYAEAFLEAAELNVSVDAPPDLAIEVVVTHPATKAIEAYRRLEVPEVWVSTLETLQILRRDAHGQYFETEQSAAFPWLSAMEIAQWVGQSLHLTDSEWLNTLRTWIGDDLQPRARAADRP